MSEITPPSYVDDGFDFPTSRPSNSGWNINKWVEGVNEQASTVGNTLSYFDDGEDLLPPASSGPGIGQTNTKYYVTDVAAKRRPQSTRYHPGVQRAVQGQIGNTLASMKMMEKKINARPADVKEHVEENKSGRTEAGKNNKRKENRGPPPGAVRVFIPPPPPTFVIHGTEGHVVVVDGSDDPIDSRPPPGLKQVMTRAELGQVRKKNRVEGAKQEKKGVSASHGGQQQTSKQDQMQFQKQVRASKQNIKPQQEQAKDKMQKKPATPPKRATPLASAIEDDVFMSGALRLPSPVQSENSWKADGPAETAKWDATSEAKSNYQAPAVESAPETPAKEKRSYLNGYNEPNETYLNAKWGDLPVRVANWASQW